jgi:hypothetical protein
MTTDQVLREFGERLGVGPIELDADGGTRIAFGEELVVDLERPPGTEVLHLHAPVGALGPGMSAEARAALLAELLEANLLGQGTGGATLALDGTLDEVVLWRGLPADGLTVDALERALETFLDHLAAWKRHLAEHGAADGAAASASALGDAFIRG